MRGLILLLLLGAALFLAGYAEHVLWVPAAIVLAVWLVLFAGRRYPSLNRWRSGKLR